MQLLGQQTPAEVTEVRHALIIEVVVAEIVSLLSPCPDLIPDVVGVAKAPLRKVLTHPHR